MNASLGSSLAQQLAGLPEALRAKVVAQLKPKELRALRYEWRFWARQKQLPPEGSWQYWLVMAGRGFGKTRVGSEWTNEKAERYPGCRIALVGETVPDVRDVMVRGESGILACSPPWFRPKYVPSKRLLTWPNGSIATTYTAEKPDQLRGPQHHFAWGDEVAKWRYADAFDQLKFGLRLGENPQAILTTTPRPIPLIKELLADDLCKVTRGTTYENSANLAKPFLSAIIRKFQGTRLGRQELEAEVLDDAPGALWKRDKDIEAHRWFPTPLQPVLPVFMRVVVAIDPSVSSDSAEAETGIVAAGLGEDGLGYVLDDASIVKPTPEQWGREAVSLYNKLEADRIIGEANNGGDLVESNVAAISKRVSFKKVHASRGKQTRAEPIAALYEQGRVRHVGSFPLLEDQMCQWEPGVSLWSPNRVDALVWALTELMLGPEAEDGLAFSIKSIRRNR